MWLAGWCLLAAGWLTRVCMCVCVHVCMCVCCLQVSQLMSVERAKLVARSQLPVQLAPRPLGQPAAAAAATAGGAQQQQDEGAGGDGLRAASERARDPETYDEGDFYSQLLKELLESGEARAPAATRGGGEGAGARQW